VVVLASPGASFNGARDTYLLVGGFARLGESPIRNVVHTTVASPDTTLPLGWDGRTTRKEGFPIKKVMDALAIVQSRWALRASLVPARDSHDWGWTDTAVHTGHRFGSFPRSWSRTAFRRTARAKQVVLGNSVRANHAARQPPSRFRIRRGTGVRRASGHRPSLDSFRAGRRNPQARRFPPDGRSVDEDG
jgi:hypothetical protein